MLNIKPCHKDHICKGYFDCDSKRYCKKNVKPEEIEYVFKGSFYLNHEDEDIEADGIEDNLIIQIRDLNLKPNEIKFISEKNIIIINKHGFNDGHRGSDHTLLKLPFLNGVNLGKEFTLNDLLIANSNLKSHKFDNWYELYCGAKCEETTNSIFVSLKFDHGS